MAEHKPFLANNPQMATLKVLRQTLLPRFLDPIPADETLRSWFTQAHIPRFKSNQNAQRGGGQVFWHVASVEKLLGRLTTLDPVSRDDASE